MKHKYVKNFNHFINIINQVISTTPEINEEFLEYIGDDKFYYKYVYTQPYCDQYTWEIRNGNFYLLQRAFTGVAYKEFNETGFFRGKNYNNQYVKLSDELKDK